MKIFFERNPKIILLLVNLFFIGLLFFILSLDIFQDAPKAEKYSILDEAMYRIRCHGKRHIVLRENKPNQNSFRIPPYDSSKKYVFRTDKNGFVEPSKIHEHSDLNIFFLGGSTTECETVDELNRFPYLVGRLLEKSTGKKINSYNAGKSGNSSIHSINNLLNKIAPLHPHIVVRMENINDLSTLLYEATYWNRNQSRSNLACFSKNNVSLRNLANEWDESPFAGMFFDPNHQKRIKEEQRRILKLFVGVTKASGAVPVLMTQANRIENNPDFTTNRGDENFNRTYRKLYLEFQNITRQVAKEENVLLIDLASAVPNGDSKYLYDSVHFNNEGSQFVAEIIAKKLKPVVKLKTK
jgi:lysophospholipase L1-like esterase